MDAPSVDHDGDRVAEIAIGQAFGRDAVLNYFLA
jgi:hypothetical protein